MKETTLKKEFNKSDVSRLRNIIKGKGNDSTKTQLGYSKKHEFHNEGDIWIENEKTWTIKNGIKQNVTKLDSIKVLSHVPLLCPCCSGPMKTIYDKKSYIFHKKCLTCVVEFENKLKIEGKYEEYEKNFINNNKRTFIKDIKQAFEDFMKSDKNTYVSEAGDIEVWKGDIDKQKLSTEFNMLINSLESSIEE